MIYMGHERARAREREREGELPILRTESGISRIEGISLDGDCAIGFPRTRAPIGDAIRAI